jgi:DnaK suppressor protein
MDQHTLTVFKEILVARLHQLLPGLKEQVFEVESSNSTGPMDEVDLTCARYQKEFEFSVRQHTSRSVSEVMGALARLRAGRFGICEECGRQIGLMRLKAQPIAVVCIDCKKELESEERRMLFQNAS